MPCGCNNSTGYSITLRDAQLVGFSDDARHAMQASPDYFVWWYTAKSIGLGVVAAALAFMVGRATKRCR